MATQFISHANPSLLFLQTLPTRPASSQPWQSNVNTTYLWAFPNPRDHPLFPSPHPGTPQPLQKAAPTCSHNIESPIPDPHSINLPCSYMRQGGILPLSYVMCFSAPHARRGSAQPPLRYASFGGSDRGGLVEGLTGGCGSRVDGGCARAWCGGGVLVGGGGVVGCCAV